jgi:Rrf2 family protein
MMRQTMMNLSKTAGYAVHALSCLDQAQGRPLFVQEIADRTGIRKPYLARIINRLVHEGLVASRRGYRGGVALACPASSISLWRIVDSLEGQSWSRECFFGLESCPVGRTCPAHAMWSQMRSRIEAALRQTTLADLTRATHAQPPPPRPEPRVPTARLAPADFLAEDEAREVASWRTPWEPVPPSAPVQVSR